MAKFKPKLFPKQWEALNACQPGLPSNLVLINGPRWAGKTQAAHEIACNHAWKTDRADICILTITQSVGIDSGVWQHLTETFLPGWINANFGMRWVREPYTQSVTKKPACKVSNKFGTTSTISLASLKNEDEVEARFKGKAYSMIWVNELSKFKKRKTFDTLKQCLRVPHLTTDQHLFLADTNPDLDEGKESWIYKLWYDFKNASLQDLADIYPDLPPDTLVPLQKRLKLIEFSVDDNLSLSKEKKSELMADFAHDEDLMKAYYWGQWVTASSDALFFKVFRQVHHVVGEIATPQNPDSALLVPEPHCSELITGWDPGDSVNSAAVIAEKHYVSRTIKSGGKELQITVPLFKFLDELVIIGENHSLEDFVIAFMKKMAYWEQEIGRWGNTRWTHWSDSNVFDRIATESQRYLNQVIYDTSVLALKQNLVKITGPIMVQAAEKGPGVLGQRVDLWRRLLFDSRVFFSKEKCPHLIESCKSLKRGKSQISAVDRSSKFKHAWDAGSYLVSSECHEELSRQCVGHLVNTRQRDGGTLVTMPM